MPARRFICFLLPERLTYKQPPETGVYGGEDGKATHSSSFFTSFDLIRQLPETMAITKKTPEGDVILVGQF
jgi:hypothetical protein